ncbi:hybrid sensor histidine kinase/response regulator transcription factor [Massilibacteroides sp.]|uniref:hybrid sensor histidine kinase/response regulator transcription factor n=1 Tax=Massilibacteroides sp. TaxID=2034766 RepID=UPI00262A2B3E|nr:hybrid sensor histidine kinase/response regulator transcription factor [Massilibacteroides sp.]MDD4515912.1 two-component regulator propeller domain-containing protein [Massilibacteroides sp.]
MVNRWLTLLLLFISSNAYPIYFKHIGMKDGLAQLSVMTIYQDELGRMWFGTEEGLSMYDGNTTISYKPTNSLKELPYGISPGNAIESITGDKNGNMYFVSDNSALFRYDLKTEKFNRLISQNIKTVLCHDQQVWFAMNDSICIWKGKTNTYDFKLRIENANIYKLFIDTEKRLWIATRGGLYCHYAGETKIFVPNEDIYDLFEDSNKNLWVATRENGMFRLKPDGSIKKFMHEPTNPNSLSSSHIRSFAEDEKGNIWIGTFLGLNVYNPQTKTFNVYSRDVIPGSLAHSSVFSTYKDKQGSLWIGTYYGGVHYFNPEADIFTYYSADNSRNDCVSYPFVGNMREDKNHNLWICTEGGGLNFFDREKKIFTHFTTDGSRNSISHDNLKSICYSPERNKLYIGTHMGGLSIYNLTDKTFNNIKRVFPDNHPELADEVVNHIELYNNEQLIFVTRKGLLKMSLDDGIISPLFTHEHKSSAYLFFIDSKGNIWNQGSGYIIRTSIKDENDKSIYELPHNGSRLYSVNKIFEDNRGHIFFGTRGSGLFELNPESEEFTHYTVENNRIQSNYCYDIVQTKRGKLLVSGEKGLSYFSPEEKKFIAITLGTALPISGINFGCGMYVCEDGEIFVGGVDGLTSFYEDALFIPEKDYNLFFSSLFVNNELVHPEANSTILKTSLPYTQEIRLKHNQNNLIFTFSTNNYINTLETPLYEYMMDGFDDKWITNTDQKISYTNLNPGKYTLYVREKQNPQRTIKMGVVVKSPFYATPLAFLIYFIVFFGIIYRYLRFKQAELVLNTSLKFERKEKERIEELNQEKLQFFSNISHEFRTPLTLIMSQIELLLQRCKTDPFLYSKLLKIYKNSNQMRSLISELLDFRKLEQGFLKLKVSEENLVSFTKEIYLSFQDVAKNKNIDYTFQASNDPTCCWIDAKQMQKTVFNLLSNAFKFTEANGIIEVVIEDFEDEASIKIIDNGIGIEPEEICKIFNRFYQSTNKINDTSSAHGSGIGLSLAKSIVELHHGNLQVESKPGYGSIFMIRLKKGKEHFKEGEVSFEKTAIKEVDIPVFAELNESEADFIKEKKAIYSILIVEDNEELLQVLVSLFNPVYTIYTATNGKDGLRKAVEVMPDLILSDVMMPEMSGTDLCVEIKNNFSLCHIPVVLLTALTSQEHSMEAYKSGADAYITKPFDSKLLLAECSSIIRNRVALKQKYTKQEMPESTLLATNPIDQEFLELISQTILENLNNPDFDMNALAKQLGLSRSSFYTKFKGLTGMTPNDFVLNYKLNFAARLLKENQSTQITEIADQTGFSSARYFTQCFKKQFHTTPAEFRKRNEKN